MPQDQLRAGDRVRLTKTPFPELPNGAEGVVTDEQDGFYLFVRFEDYPNDYEDPLTTEAQRNTWALLGTEVEKVEA